VSNYQFSKFIEAGGYREERWWTNNGWLGREQDGWVEPRYWQDKKWNSSDKPVVGVSWYESIAFCLWLSNITGENILLPTEQQWQRAAQGDNERLYPWGNEWDARCCNNNVNQNGSGQTTPVQKYKDKGDSPFGVTDMSGNVWEWCLSDYFSENNNINRFDIKRKIRGGSWFNDIANIFRCDDQTSYHPHNRQDSIGFRIARSI